MFPQFDRSPEGELTPLPNPGVDTGMGLERMAAILQGVHSNYEIDLFRNLIRQIGSMAGINDEVEMLANDSVRVIADHIRSSAFLVADGVAPGNENRSYVLRRIIRRALRHGYKLELPVGFFSRLVAPLAEEMGDAYPALVDKQDEITQALRTEEEVFASTLSRGMALLERVIEELDSTVIPGDVAFRLYDTYGFPVDLTADIARERSLTVDMAGFEKAMDAQRAKSRAAGEFESSLGQRIQVDGSAEFTGYTADEGNAAVVGLFDPKGEPVGRLEAGDPGVLTLDRTPFYAESGGQIGDTGIITAGENRFVVQDTQVGGAQVLHLGTVEAGSFGSGDRVNACIDAERRRLIKLNHSATHLMHAALRQVLGEHVEQKGSLVAPDRLRFDFSHADPVTPEELAAVERQVNLEIQRNTEVVVEHLGYDAAIEKGAMALFGEKYADEVRVLSMGGAFSVELCGGTHVARTGDIGVFRIVSETGIAAGVRRIEAVTGPGALAWLDEGEAVLNAVGGLVKAHRAEVAEKVSSLLEENRRLARELEKLERKLAANQSGDLASGAVEVGGIKLLATRVDGDAKSLMPTLDHVRARLGQSVIVLGHVDGGKVSLIAGVSKTLTEKVNAPELIELVGAQVGARGGGRPDMARAGGGTDPDKLADALASVGPWLQERLG